MTARRLSPDAVRAIRATLDARKLLPTDGELAARYGVSQRTVRAIGQRVLYRDVPDATAPPPVPIR
jgi:DNA-binding FadR family transcriptional regulator